MTPIGDVWAGLTTPVFSFLSALLVLVVGQSVIRFIVEPTLEVRKTIGEIHALLILYGELSAEPLQGHLEGEERDAWIAKVDEASERHRQKAGELYGRAYAVPFYPLAALFRILPRRSKVLHAGNKLIELGWNITSGLHDQRDNAILRQEVRMALGLPAATYPDHIASGSSKGRTPNWWARLRHRTE